jgi:hypothetical protein
MTAGRPLGAKSGNSASAEPTSFLGGEQTFDLAAAQESHFTSPISSLLMGRNHVSLKAVADSFRGRSGVD